MLSQTIGSWASVCHYRIASRDQGHCTTYDGINRKTFRHYIINRKLDSSRIIFSSAALPVSLPQVAQCQWYCDRVFVCAHTLKVFTSTILHVEKKLVGKSLKIVHPPGGSNRKVGPFSFAFPCYQCWQRQRRQCWRKWQMKKKKERWTLHMNFIGNPFCSEIFRILHKVISSSNARVKSAYQRQK